MISSFGIESSTLLLLQVLFFPICILQICIINFVKLCLRLQSIYIFHSFFLSVIQYSISLVVSGLSAFSDSHLQYLTHVWIFHFPSICNSILFPMFLLTIFNCIISCKDTLLRNVSYSTLYEYANGVEFNNVETHLL